MSKTGKMVMLCLTLWSLAQPSSAADDLIASQLVDQARAWQQKDRDDLAADLWRKLLRANPQHPEALVKLGFIQARAGNIQEAEALYIRATKLRKPPRGLMQLAVTLGTGKGSPTDFPHLPSGSQAGKLVAPDAVATSPVGSEQKVRGIAASARQRTGMNQKPAQKTTVDALNLKFTNSMETVR